LLVSAICPASFYYFDELTFGSSGAVSWINNRFPAINDLFFTTFSIGSSKGFTSNKRA
jgi:hypothetical protein